MTHLIDQDILEELYYTEKMSYSEIGKSLGCESQTILNIWNKGKRKATHPDLNIIGHSGKDHWNWKGGISSKNIRFRQSSEYKNWRYAVFSRDNWTCQNCKKRGGSLVAHHIIPFATDYDLRLVVLNGITLCNVCHKNIHQEDNNE